MRRTFINFTVTMLAMVLILQVGYLHSEASEPTLEQDLAISASEELASEITAAVVEAAHVSRRPEKTSAAAESKKEKTSVQLEEVEKKSEPVAAKDAVSDEEQAPQVKTLEAPPEPITVKPVSFIALSPDLQNYLAQKCDHNAELIAMFVAIMYNESRFQTHTIGVNKNGTRDWGLGQINDVNYNFLRQRMKLPEGMSSLLDGKTNIDAMYILWNYHMGVARGNINGALLSYQRGEGAYSRMYARGVYTDATHTRVLGYYHNYLQLYATEGHTVAV